MHKMIRLQICYIRSIFYSILFCSTSIIIYSILFYSILLLVLPHSCFVGLGGCKELKWIQIHYCPNLSFEGLVKFLQNSLFLREIDMRHSTLKPRTNELKILFPSLLISN